MKEAVNTVYFDALDFFEGIFIPKQPQEGDTKYQPKYKNLEEDFIMQTNVRKLVTMAMFAALSTLLMFFEFPLPFLPTFLKLDFSDVPVLIGAFIFGPIAGIAITLVKDIIHALFATTTAGVGELADFIITGSFVLTASLIYNFKKNTLFAVWGCIAGIIAMIIFGSISNYYLILPFYSKFMPMDQIFAMCAKVNPFIKNTWTYILYAIAPFNLIKASVIAVITLIVYKRLANIISMKFKKI